VTSEFRFVDAHHHLWDLDRHVYDWLMGDGWPDKTAALGDYHEIRRTYLVDDFLAETRPSGLVGSVHLQADWTGSSPVDETRWLQEAADRTGFPQAIIAWADLRDPGLAYQLASHLESPNVRGIRHVPTGDMLDDEDFARGFARLGDLGLSFDLAVTPNDMAAAARLIRAHPGTTVIVEHTGIPLARTPEYFEYWRRALRHLSDIPAVTVKVSGLGTTDHHWTVDSLRPWVLETIDQFGADRTMFGTNWPVDRLYSTYEELIAAYRDIVVNASPVEQAALFADTAERVYRV
jgi:predicted TIM-barrel fold metal-dependent hydrolase